MTCARDWREPAGRMSSPRRDGTTGCRSTTPGSWPPYWRDEYDWRAAEARLNDFSQFVTTVDGQRIHFLHVRSPRADATPLLLTHGWPGSIVEFTDMIRPLTDPDAHGAPDAPAFHVVIPSLPGFGFSGPTTERGWNVIRITSALATLMGRLGSERYGAHGGDWGASVTLQLARIAADALLGAHVTRISSAVAPADLDPDSLPDLDGAERAAIIASQQRQAQFQRDELDYGYQQSTRPQTLAYALGDSPVGQLAWIVEKFHAWTDNHGRPEDALDRDQLLTNVSIYWLTNTAGSSSRIYYETASAWGATPEAANVPTAVAVFPHDVSLPVRRLAERTEHVVRWTEFDRGGHFPGLEQPALLTSDIRASFDALWTAATPR